MTYFCLEIQKNMEQKLTTKEEYLKRINVIVEYINNHLDENIDLRMLA